MTSPCQLSNHLPTPERAIGFRKGRDVDDTHVAAVQVRQALRGLGVTPWVAPPLVRAGYGARGDFPLRLGRKSASSPTTIRLRLVPTYVNDGSIGLERDERVIVTPQPSVRASPPISGVLSAGLHASHPPFETPEVTSSVAAILDERAKRIVRNWSACDTKRLEVYLVRPLLVVEDERLVGRSTDTITSAGNLNVAWKRTAIRGRRGTLERRSRIAQTLPRVRTRLTVHVFVKRAQETQIRHGFRWFARLEPTHHLVFDVLQIREELSPRGERERPPRPMRHVKRVEHLVAIWEELGVPAELSQKEDLMEIRDVPELPPRRIDAVSMRHFEPVVFEVAH